MRLRVYPCHVPAALALLFFVIGSARAQPAADSSSPGAPRVNLFAASPTTAPTFRRVLAAEADDPVHITLAQAKQQANRAVSAAQRAGQFGVEAAKQHRLALQAEYFPKVSATAFNFHYNKFMGQEIEIERPILGTVTAGLPLLGKNETFVDATVTQPITPILKIHEAVKIARADERVAQAKAAALRAEASGQVEKTYFELLVALRQEGLARNNLRTMPANRLIASASPAVVSTAYDPAAEVEWDKELAEASAKIQELTSSLNVLLGLAPGTKLDLEDPEPLIENLSFQDLADKAVGVNPEVVDAQQTVEKAKAGVKLAKLDYVPEVAGMWGYFYNGNVIPLLPRDFSFVGVVATFNIFDFGKREHTIKERNAQLGMAEAALELAKMKASAGLKQSYSDLVRARKLAQIASQAHFAIRTLAVRYSADDPDVRTSGARLEIEMLQADLAHRDAYAKVQALMGDPSGGR